MKTQEYFKSKCINGNIKKKQLDKNQRTIVWDTYIFVNLSVTMKTGKICIKFGIT